MKGLLIVCLAVLALTSAADKEDKKGKKRSFEAYSGYSGAVPAVQYGSSSQLFGQSSSVLGGDLQSSSVLGGGLQSSSVLGGGLESSSQLLGSGYGSGVENLHAQTYSQGLQGLQGVQGLQSSQVLGGVQHFQSAQAQLPLEQSYSQEGLQGVQGLQGLQGLQSSQVLGEVQNFQSAQAQLPLAQSYSQGEYQLPVQAQLPVQSQVVQSYSQEQHVNPTHSYNYISKAVPVYVPKPVPYEVTKTVQVPTPYKVTVPKPYAVPVQVRVPVEVPKPYEVKVEHRVPVAVPERVPVEIPRPYPVYKTKQVRVEVEKPVYVKEKVEVRVPVPKPYPVEVPTPVHIRVPQRILLKVPQIAGAHAHATPCEHAAAVQAGRVVNIPNYVYGQSYGNLEGQQNLLAGQSLSGLSDQSSFGRSSLEQLSVGQSGLPSQASLEQSSIGQSLSNIAEQSLVNSQAAFDQSVQGLGDQSNLGIGQEFQHSFGANQGLQSFGNDNQQGLQSYEEFRRSHPEDGVVNVEKESVSVESKSETGVSGGIFESRSGFVEGRSDETVSVEPQPAAPAVEVSSTSEPAVEHTSAEVKEESTVPSATTDIV
ncbi:unnamed protein product [Diabrotica balteata]|uniref:Uncharacterized protein n=1 Tax=Diabrotica balteata TaxID=107213 RepID=A0A9P0DS90_DIABA|nr:unnamed protein product [Diabrotica balteata]